MRRRAKIETEMAIHPTAIIDRTAEISAGVTIGPYCIIGRCVVIGTDTRLDSHVSVEGSTTIGERCHFYSHVSVGTDPQDLKYKGEATHLRIGNENVFREFVTLNRGTQGGGGVTTIGDRNFFMAYAHVAHDSHMGSDIIMANAATLAGHVSVGNHATVGAFSAVHQFCRVGPHAFIGGFSVVTRDALPYVKTVGDRNQAKIYGINSIGLQRKGIPEASINELKKLYRILFRSDLNTTEALKHAREDEWTAPEVATLLDFIETSERGFIH
ncbi:MAG TPA: acyl-ACP--UDP-N-acetylglucosamine O-acyltransferase [Acidobacteriota bacterium]|nr:acyl-ACP--UDP-N-acetylglucosamine O-acyltransferase [Acidobacteriota bacterium]